MKRIQRCLAALAGLCTALLALGSFAPAALARPMPPDYPPGVVPLYVVHTVATGGTPGWQTALIAVGAALITAVAAVLLDRARAARRRVTAQAT